MIAIVGAVTVVLSANASDTRLDPKSLLEAISQRAFQIYTIVYVVGIFILSGLSEGPAGRRWVYVDIGLCALFGKPLVLELFSQVDRQYRRLYGAFDESGIYTAHSRMV